MDDEVDGVQAAQYALIARALFEDQGTSAYPDATFTLRLAFGQVKGFEADGNRVPPTPRSAGPSTTPPPTAMPIPTRCRRAGSRPATPAGSTSTRR